MTTSCTDWDHPYYETIHKLDSSKDKINFFTEQKSKRMKYVSLGEALDFICSGAGMNCVYWDLNSKGLTEFIDSWMQAQEPRIEHKRVYLSGNSGVYHLEETKREYQYIWNRFDRDFDEALPFINHTSCPRDKEHKGTINVSGITRCSHVNHLKFKPSFIQDNGLYPDEHSGFLRPHFYESEPNIHEGLPSDPDRDEQDNNFFEAFYGDQLRKNQRLVDLFNSEEPIEVLDPCFAIISDKGSYLPLETVLSRVNVNNSLYGDKGSLFPFSGFTIASFAKAWYNQKGEKKLFTPNGKMDCYKVIKDFQPFSSDD